MDDKYLEQLPLSKIKQLDYSVISWLQTDYVEVEARIKLRVFKIPSQKPEAKINIVVVAGLCSNFLGWIDIDYQLSKIANIFHIETREKKSAIHSKRRINYSMDQYALDIKSVIKHFNLDKKGFFLFGDSFGSEVVIKYLDKKFTPPKGLILISPEQSFSFSLWMKIIFTIFPYWLFYPLIPFLKFILKYLRTDMKTDPGTYYMNSRNIVTSDPKRMKRSALGLFIYKSSADYQKITCPTFIIAASTDKMHSYEKSLEIAEKIPDTIFEDVTNYQETHNRKIARKIMEFIKKIDKEG